MILFQKRPQSLDNKRDRFWLFETTELLLTQGACIFMLTPIRRDNQDGKDFDALAFEIKHYEDFENAQKPIIESDYEIDSESDWCGSIYRVWKNARLLGVFYQKQGKWLAEPFYLSERQLKPFKSLAKSFQSNEQAINYIIRNYESR